MPGWPADPPRIDGKVVLVTGAASGLGLAAAQGFASLGATVLAVARNEQRAKDAERALSGNVRGVACDASSVAAVRELARGLEGVDVLVNNAGVMPPERARSVDGIELTFATHVLAPWVLMQARELGPELARVINVGSGGMYAQALNAGDLMSEHDEYNPKTFYSRSKRAEMVITEQWAQRLPGGVAVHAMHPGWADTRGHPGRDARLPQADRPDPAQRRRGRRHDRLARRGRATTAQHRQVLDGPPPTADALSDRRLSRPGAGPRGAVGALRAPRR